MQIPGYTINEIIGTGGMATVYKGIQDSLKRKVAIKVIHKKLADQSFVLQQFERESYIIAQLNHPHVIHVIDRGLLEDKTPYFIMEYLQGQDLAQLIHQGSLETNKKLELLTQVCKALSYAHKNGVIHRDIKPANIFIDLESHAHVLDFGIAQFCNSKADPDTEDVVMGTLAYMSPEQQISSSDTTILSDIYSLGVVMYLLFTGQKPIGNFAPPSSFAAGISPLLDTLILNCLKTDPTDRPSSADKIQDILLQLLRGSHLKPAQIQRAEEGINSLKDRYALLEIIKEEKYSAVYLYENKKNHSLIIIKKRPIWSKGFNETNLLKPLSHKHITKIHGTSKNNRTYIIVMEYLNGGNLQDRMMVAMPWDKALRNVREICLGLIFSHKNNVIHGNLRPSNVLFDENGLIKISDFGLDDHYQIGDEKNWYKIQNEEKTKRTDIYSLGVILYQLLTGALPRRKNKQLVPLEQFNTLPDSLQELVTRMLARSPLSRQKSMQLVLDEVDSLLEYHVQLCLEQEKTKQWEQQQAIETEQKKQKQQKLKKMITRILLASALLCLVAIGLFFQELSSIFI